MLARQGFKCAVCGASLRGQTRGGPVLDHCHESGFVRAVLCRVCNTGEGKVRTVMTRFGGGTEKSLDWLIKMVRYLHLHRTPQTDLIHPTHKTEDQKREVRNAKARKARAAKKGAGP